METPLWKSPSFWQMQGLRIRQIEPDFVGTFSSIRAEPAASNGCLALAGGFWLASCDELHTIGDGIFSVKIAHYFSSDLNPDRFFIFRVFFFEDQQGRFKAIDAPGFTRSTDGFQGSLMVLLYGDLDVKFRDPHQNHDL